MLLECVIERIFFLDFVFLIINSCLLYCNICIRCVELYDFVVLLFYNIVFIGG